MPKVKRQPLRPPAEAAKLVEDNRGLVGLVLKRARHPERLRDELEAAGLVGLWKAARLFDESLGFAFSTYAVKAIRWAVRLELRREWDRREGEVASLDDVADGYSADLRHPAARDDGERDRRESWESLAPYLPRLTARQREAVQLLADGLTAAEVARRLGVTAQRVAQVRASAARRIERLAAGQPLRKRRAPGPAGIPADPAEPAGPYAGPRLLTADAVAAMLGCAKRTLWRMVAEGAFPDATFRPDRKLVRWSSVAVERWLAGKAPPAEAEAPADLLTAKKAGRMLGVASGTVLRWRRDGALKGYLLGGGRWRFARADVLALLQPTPVTAAS